MKSLCVLKCPGPKVRANGSFWSLGNLILEAGLSPSVMTEGPNFLSSPFSVFYPLLLFSPSIILSLIPSLPSSFLLLSPSPLFSQSLLFSSFPFSQQMAWYPLSHFFFWQLSSTHTRVHLTTHMHEHFMFFHLSVPPSAYLSFSPSFCPYVSFSLFVSAVTDKKGHALTVMKECKLDEFDGLVVSLLFLISLVI